ncbi:MAG: type II secretion system protein [Candidatus Zixiibacteriota bacterium]
MKLSCLKNSKGVTLVELIVALGLSSILLVIIVSGSLFVQSYLRSWSQQGKLWEELVFIRQEITLALQAGRQMEIFPDSLICLSVTGARTKYKWNRDTFSKNGQNLLSRGLYVDSLIIVGFDSPGSGADTLTWRNELAGCYSMVVVVSDGRGSSEKTQTLVRNQCRYRKHSQ